MYGLIFVDYLEKGKTMNGVYYAGLLPRLLQRSDYSPNGFDFL